MVKHWPSPQLTGLRTILKTGGDDYLMSAELIAIGVVIACLSFSFGIYVGLGAKEGLTTAEG
jgi:hypothetical protein